jgi:ABC-type Fe3+ transport system permease subunit
VNGRLLQLAARVVFVCVFVPVLVWPALALIGRCIAQGEAPDGGFTFTSRQLGLLWRSVWLSACATGVCLVVSLPGAIVVGRVRRLTRHPLLAAAMMALLLSPPVVCAFGWERILPPGFNAPLRCIGVWALWAWPIPAMVIGAGWARLGAAAYEAALLEASPTSAFMHAVLPALRRHVVLAGLIVFVLFFNDYGVPHACGLLVYATELLGWAASSTHTVDTVWPALLSIGVTTVALLGVLLLWRRCAADAEADVVSLAGWPSTGAMKLVALACFVLSWGLPVGALAAGLASFDVMAEAYRAYATDLAWTLSLAAGSGAVAVALGLGLVAIRTARWPGLLLAMAFGALPGALVGEALVAGYNHGPVSWIYDHWPIVAMAYVARFSWVGVLTAMLVERSTAQDLIDQARVDGASRASILAYIQIPLYGPLLLCGAAVVAAMAVADLAASKLVRVPDFAPIAHILMEKFHRFEDGMLISLSLWLVAATIPPVLLLMAALRRWRMA